MTLPKKLNVASIFSLAGMGLYRFGRPWLARGLRLPLHRYRVSYQPGLRVPMPDGITLAADLYTPRGRRRAPTILICTPYGRSWETGINGAIVSFAAHRFAERGYNVLVQGVRGCLDSAVEGAEFEPFLHEAADGQATLAWIEQQTWFNGSIGMWGPSYMGFVPLAVAPHAPRSLKAITTLMSGARMPVVGLRDGALGADLQLRWIHSLEHIQSDSPATWLLSRYNNFRSEMRTMRRAAATLPLAQADQVVAGRPIPFFQEWLAHADINDPYWQALDPSLQMHRITAAAHLVGGWYDIFLRETLEDYQLLHQSGRQPYLTIGPWKHADVRNVLESLQQSLAWFDAHLKGDRRELRPHPVWVYIMGRGTWQAMDAWPPPTQPRLYFLQPGQALGFQAPLEGEPEFTYDTYLYDPADPTPALGGNLLGVHAGRVDNRSLESRPDVLTYTTPRLEKDLLVMGAPRASLYVHSSRATTDFFVRLCDVHPNGASYNICDGFLRLQPGQGQRQPDGSLRIELDLFSTAHCFSRGHHLRLQISSGAHPRWMRNLGGDEPYPSAVTMYPAQQTIYHDPAHPSQLSLPEGL